MLRSKNRDIIYKSIRRLMIIEANKTTLLIWINQTQISLGGFHFYQVIAFHLNLFKEKNFNIRYMDFPKTPGQCRYMVALRSSKQIIVGDRKSVV